MNASRTSRRGWEIRGKRSQRPAAVSIINRIASGLLTPSLVAFLSTRASVAGGRRTVTGVAFTAGRPRFFLTSSIDLSAMI